VFQQQWAHLLFKELHPRYALLRPRRQSREQAKDKQEAGAAHRGKINA
jgi:hypothetical protein